MSNNEKIHEILSFMVKASDADGKKSVFTYPELLPAINRWWKRKSNVHEIVGLCDTLIKADDVMAITGGRVVPGGDWTHTSGICINASTKAAYYTSKYLPEKMPTRVNVLERFMLFIFAGASVVLTVMTYKRDARLEKLETERQILEQSNKEFSKTVDSLRSIQQQQLRQIETMTKDSL